ncbi:patatin [Bacteroidia bacterium]|nr:patatin [Bacteroidia bacterium]
MLKKFFIFFILTVCAQNLAAQTVGLVMSGGGAKGMVHLGVIKALEENNIPIDYIAGTSAGALVGAMYASGYTVEEIVEFFTSKTFAQWSSGEYMKEGSYFYKQSDPDAEMLAVRAHLRQGKLTAAFPTNLVAPYQMDFVLLDLFAQASAAAGNDLNRLMIPFRALSTNAYDKVPYSPRRGDLGTLVRASISFPGVFKPTVIDSLLLFDGGIINNFPADVLIRDFAPDYIIGSNCSYNYARPQEDDVFSHLTALASSNTNYDIPADKGWMLNFEPSDVSLLDFDKSLKLVQMGYEKTMEIIPQIQGRVLRQKLQEDLEQQRVAFKSKMYPVVFDSIQIAGASPRLRRYINNRLLRRKKTTFSLQQFKSRYFDVVSDDGLTTIVPIAKGSDSDSLYTLKLRISPAPNLKLAFGGYYSSVANQMFASVSYSYYAPFAVRAYANFYLGDIYRSYKAMLRSDFRIGRFNIPLFQELGIIGNMFDYYTNNPDALYSDTRPDFMQDKETFGFFSIGTPFVGNGALRLIVKLGQRGADYFRTKDFQTRDIPENMQFNFLLGGLSIEHNSLNYKTLATQGLKQTLSARYIMGTEYHTFGTTSPEYRYDTSQVSKKVGTHLFWQVKLSRAQYFQMGKYLSLGYFLEGVYSHSVQFMDRYATLLTLPYFEPMESTHGLFLENFHSNIYAALGIIPTFTIRPNVLLRTELYLFQPFMTLQEDNTLLYTRPSYTKELRNSAFMGAASLVWQTFIGNVSLSAFYYDRSQMNFSNWFFSLNFGYYLHNRRAFN